MIQATNAIIVHYHGILFLFKDKKQNNRYIKNEKLKQCSVIYLYCSLFFSSPSAQIKDPAKRYMPRGTTRARRQRECSEGIGWESSVPLRENSQAEVSSSVCQQPKYDQAGHIPILREGKNYVQLLGNEV